MYELKTKVYHLYFQIVYIVARESRIIFKGIKILKFYTSEKKVLCTAENLEENNIYVFGVDQPRL
jgi:hypothetical protein